jgi:hypothetical protein
MTSVPKQPSKRSSHSSTLQLNLTHIVWDKRVAAGLQWRQNQLRFSWKVDEGYAPAVQALVIAVPSGEAPLSSGKWSSVTSVSE